MRVSDLLFPLALGCALAPGLLFAQNDLLMNPGFESGQKGWTFAEKTAMSAVAPEASHRGASGLKVEDRSPDLGSSVMSEHIPVKPGQKAKLEFWARTKDEKFIGVNLVPFSGDKQWTTVDDRIPTVGLRDVSGKWVKYQLEFVIPDHVDAIAVWIHSWSASQGAAEFDDFELKIK